MASRDPKDHHHHHQPLLSSLVVRPSSSDGAADAADGGRAADYEPGEVRRDQRPPYSRPDRYAAAAADDLALMLRSRTWALRKAYCNECSLGS